MIGDQLDEMSQESHRILQEWLESCTRGRKIARNTAAIGIVVLDHLKRKCPVSREEVISRGGEVKGARSGLGERLERYSIPSHYLKEITTRQAHQDGQRLFERFAWGEKLAELANNDRDSLLLELIDTLRGYAFDWLERQNLKFEIDRRQSPIVWIYQIVENAKARSGGVVEQHLIGAKLQRRFTGKQIPNFPAHAGDSQTGRDGDFAIENLVYHVTASPGHDVLEKCASNIRIGWHPILLVPQREMDTAKVHARDERIEGQVTIISIEDFVALNIIELAAEEKKDFFSILSEIVQIYNARLEEAETDLSLKIDVS